jgi:succinate-semialdehyde dehydrogenase / glutarate-semialdehyde dehydrogenase
VSGPVSVATVAAAGLRDEALLRDSAYVDGTWVAGGDSGRFSVENPSTGETVADLPSLSRAQAAEAVAAAHRAWPGWRSRSAKDRAAVLRRWFDLVVEHTDDLARIITLEEGKPLAEARGEVAYAASFVEWFAEEAKRVRGDVLPAPGPTGRIVVLKEPVGVCAAITPWNFPAAMITRKAAPALAAGCTMVVKPASQTPLTALALAELADRAGVPAGVFNVVVGGAREIGAELTGNPLVRKVTFTGSTEVGRLLLAQSAETIKKTSMELGGNAPILVFDDADLDVAVSGVLTAKYRNTGQSCIGANRFLVHTDVEHEFTTRLAAAINAMSIGDGTADPVPDLGPCIDEARVSAMRTLVDEALAAGAKKVTRDFDLPGPAFAAPAILTDVPDHVGLAREEVFGPVAGIFPFRTEQEALDLANATEMGLAAYFYTRDQARVWRVAEHLDNGIVGINNALPSVAFAPMGGTKQSGLGREGAATGLEEFEEVRYLSLGV